MTPSDLKDEWSDLEEQMQKCNYVSIPGRLVATEPILRLIAEVRRLRTQIRAADATLEAFVTAATALMGRNV